MSNVGAAGRVVKAYFLDRNEKQREDDRRAARAWARSIEAGHVVVVGSGEVETFAVWVPSALRELGLKLQELPGQKCFEVVPFENSRRD